MLSKLFGWIVPFKSHIFAMVGVIAIAGVGAAIIANRTIEVQSDRIDTLVEINRDWARQSDIQQKMRALEQENTLLLQAQLAAIETQSAEQSEQLKRLEESDVEVKKLLGTRLPNSLRELLNK